MPCFAKQSEGGQIPEKKKVNESYATVIALRGARFISKCPRAM